MMQSILVLGRKLHAGFPNGYVFGPLPYNELYTGCRGIEYHAARRYTAHSILAAALRREAVSIPGQAPVFDGGGGCAAQCGADHGAR